MTVDIPTCSQARPNKFLFSFLYAHKVHTLIWTDLNKPEKWGFASV